MLDFESIKQIVEEFFNGQYEVKKFLGEGSFSNVYLVKHEFLDDLRAMKIIKEPLKSKTNTKTIFQEVKIATKLRNENIINIYDAGIISHGDDLAYFVMEYVPGGDLEDYLNSFINSNIQMPILRVLNIIKQILSGLNVLHSSNPPIIHRDLKLNNILLNYDAYGEIQIKISDFGFAKEITTNLSDEDIVGTRPYMAPECFNKTISKMTDIYAVGVIFYKLLTTQFPYEVDKFSLNELLNYVPWKNQLIPPSQFNKNIDDKLDEIVCKCLEYDYEKRYQSVNEILNDIESLMDDIESKQNLTQSYDGNEYVDDYSDYIINSNILKAFELAKNENQLNEAIEILEREILKDYDIRNYYGETLRMWKSNRPDVKLISKAFTVNLKAKNYNLSNFLLKEALAYNPAIKHKYQHFIDLWDIFISLSKDKNLIKAVLDLENLMGNNKDINNIYLNVINVLKTYDVNEIIRQAINLVKMNNLVDAANLMEFAVLYDDRLRQKYEYKLSLWKQNLEIYYKHDEPLIHDSIDYAIDLGTSDSIISYYNNGTPIIIKNHSTGEKYTPSAVLIDETGEIQVGKVAKDAIIEKNTNAITEFKHDMGFSIPFKSKNSTKSLYPEELSAEILKDLRLSVYEQCGENMEHAVVCIPANSNPLKTKAIRDACELAGFRSYNLIFEPIAVAVAYELNKSQENNGLWMVYDLGGATFKASLIKDNGKTIEIISTMSMDNLGGNSIDWKIVDEIFAPEIIRDLDLDDFKRDNSKYIETFSKLKKSSEMAKIELSTSDSVKITIPNLFDNYDFIYNLKIDEFKEILLPLLKTTFDLCHNLISQNGLNIWDIDDIILVGGSCLSPMIVELIDQEFNLSVKNSVDPLTVVSRGAAIYAGNLEKPGVNSKLDSVSLILNQKNQLLMGRVFSLDNKSSFLGYNIEFINTKNNDSSGKIPLNFDGTFKTSLNDEDYIIKIYDEDRLIEIDSKSPNRINNWKFHIPLFGKYFNFSNENIRGYDELTDSIHYLNEYGKFKDWELLDYIDRLVEISNIDKNASNQCNIHINYLQGIISDTMRDLEFSILLDNVKNKSDFLNENINLDNKDFAELKSIHENLVEKYVKANKSKVIVECFYNLKFEGLYRENRELSKNLIDKGNLALTNQNYDDLFKLVKRLYEIDER